MVSPGPTKTEVMTKAGLDEATLSGLNDYLINQIPLKKMGTAEDVAKLVIYLSDDTVSSFMTGTEIVIDGGMLL
jgi:NAD(P)-dependent dehydrogenase (short-subunit alcohol dehydrogenase family)